jgi:glucokinase/transcriptional regulator of PTS gene
LTRSAGKPELLKEINRGLVFDILKSTRSISRPELAARTGLSRATIAVLIDQLLAAGLVREQGLGSSSGGRPPVVIEFNPDAGLALGACMHDLDWHLVLTNLDAQIRDRIDLHIPRSSPEEAVECLSAGVRQLMARTDGSRLLPAIGLGTPGLVDIRSGVIKLAADLGWIDVPFASMVKESLGLDAYIANRSKVGALAEYWYGVGQNVHELIYISIGTGVSAGIVYQGTLFLGANSSAGELGHMAVLPDGPICPCGSRGCLQQLVSEEAIVDSARRRMRAAKSSILHRMAAGGPGALNTGHIFEAAEKGDRVALQTLEETASYLGIAIANLINLLNPNLILLGGPVGQASEILADMIREKVRQRVMAHPGSAVRILRSSLGAEAGAIGASVLVLQRASSLFFHKNLATRKASR